MRKKGKEKDTGEEGDKDEGKLREKIEREKGEN